MKIILILLAGFVALAAVAIGGAAWWFSENGEELMAGIQDSKDEGKAFGGATSEAAECIPPAIERSQACGQTNVMCQTRVQTFLHGCLAAAPVPLEECQDAPGPLEVHKQIGWQTTFCAKYGGTVDHACSRVAAAVHGYCHIEREP